MAFREKRITAVAVGVATLLLFACLASGAAAFTISAAREVGPRVYFATDQPLLPALDTDGSVDLYLRSDGGLSLQSIGDPGCQPGCGNGAFDVEPSGELEPAGELGVLFSTRESLTAADSDGSLDIYLRSPSGLELVSQGPSGFNGAFDATLAATLPDGSATLFGTAEKLVAADTDASVDLYSRAGGETTLVSQGPNGFNGAFDATLAASSDDGAVIFFLSSEQLVAADTDSSVDLYERAGEATALVSRGTSGFNGAFDVDDTVRTSAAGDRTIFSSAEKLSPSDSDEMTDVYMRFGGTTTVISEGTYDPLLGEQPVELNALSPSANWAIFSTDQVIDEKDRDATGRDIYEWFYAATRIGSQGPKQSALSHPSLDAEFVGFAPTPGIVYFETAEQLVAADGDNRIDIYARETGTVTYLVSQGGGGWNGPNDATFAGVSEDGERAYFTTAEQLSDADDDGSVDLYERFKNATTALVSGGEISGNGAFDATPLPGSGGPMFLTDEQLVAGDGDGEEDLYRRVDGHARLVSVGKNAPPPPVIAASDPASPSNDNQPLLSGAAEAGSTVRLYSDPSCSGTQLAIGSAAEFGAPGLAVSVPGDATTSIRAQATDANNNTSECSEPFVYVEDSSVAAPVLAGVDPPGPANQNSPRVSGSAEEGAAIQVFAEPGCGGSPAASGTSAELATGLAVAVADDTVTPISARATDPVGNVSACSAPVSYTEDSTPPETSATGPTKTRDRTPTFTLTSSEPGSTFMCKVDGKPNRSCSSPFTTLQMKPGFHQIRITATDVAGNVDATPAVRRPFIKKKKRKHHRRRR